MLIPVKYVGKPLPKEIKNKIINKEYSVEDLKSMYADLLNIDKKNKSSIITNAIVFFIIFAYLGYQCAKSLDSALFGLCFGLSCYLIIMIFLIYYKGQAKSKFIKLAKKYYSNEFDIIINNTENNKINNSLYGGFVISKNITHNGIKAKWIFREQSSIKECNGWNIYSENDDQEYVTNPSNFEIVSAETINKFVPILLSIYNAPYGTDLTIKYNSNNIIGFINTKTGEEISINQILNK